MPYGIPPTSLLEALQEMLNPQKSLADLLMPGTVPQGRDISAPANPFSAMNPDALSALEGQLSGAMNAKSGMENAAMLEGRPDLFVNQAINNPEQAPFYMEKAGMAETRRGEKAATEERKRQEEVAKQDAQQQMTERLISSIGPEMAGMFAKKITSGEDLTNEDIAQWQQIKYEKEKKAFDLAKQTQMGKALNDARRNFKVTIHDNFGNPKVVPPDMNDPEQVKALNEYLNMTRQQLESDFGYGPEPPVMATSVSKPTQSNIQERINPKTGKKEYFNQPMTTPTIPENAPTTLVQGPPPKAKPKEAPAAAGTLKAKLQEYKQYDKPKEQFQGTSQEVHNFEANKAQKGKEIAMGIIQAAIRAGKQPAQIVQMAKADPEIPPDIKKLIEQFAMRF